MQQRTIYILRRMPFLRRIYRKVTTYKSSLEYRKFQAIANNNQMRNQSKVKNGDTYYYDNDIKIKLDLNDYYEWKVYRQLQKGRLVEPGTSEIIKATLSEGDIFVDVGANIGIFTLLAAKYVGKTGRVICFEPLGYTYNKLMTNIALNNYKNVVAYKLGVSEAQEKRKLYIDSKSNDLNSMFRTSNKFETVYTVRLDDIIRSSDRLKIIKIDCEGCELGALKGAERLLSIDNGIQVIAEFNFDYSATDLFNYLHKRFEIFGINNVMGAEMVEVNDVLKINTGNVICLPKRTENSKGITASHSNKS